MVKILLIAALMVTLGNQNPTVPKAGSDFSVEALDGNPPYKFTYYIGEGEIVTIEQDGPILEIKPIPRGTTGQVLYIAVEDDNGDTAEMVKRIK